jgi:hypothetical protein
MLTATRRHPAIVTGWRAEMMPTNTSATLV